MQLKRCLGNWLYLFSRLCDFSTCQGEGTGLRSQFMHDTQQGFFPVRFAHDAQQGVALKPVGDKAISIFCRAFLRKRCGIVDFALPREKSL